MVPWGGRWVGHGRASCPIQNPQQRTSPNLCFRNRVPCPIQNLQQIRSPNLCFRNPEIASGFILGSGGALRRSGGALDRSGEPCGAMGLAGCKIGDLEGSPEIRRSLG